MREKKRKAEKSKYEKNEVKDEGDRERKKEGMKKERDRENTHFI